MTSEYAWVTPHAGPVEEPTTTRPHQVGVAFSGHRDLVYESGGRSARADIRPGSAILSGPAPIRWLRVREVTEAVEIYPEPALLADAAAAVRQQIGRGDGTVLAIASVLRGAHLGVADVSDVGASTLAHRLAAHVLARYAGVRAARPGLLDPGTVDRVTDLIEARLHGPLSLDDLAAEARLSPYHFARSFALTTGSPPHRFVTSRRMDRARHLLWGTDRPVDQVAESVGFANLSHFRRTFRRFHGVPPSALRG